ncbi:TetR/AcrR family transcriptional regulator [Polymorphobacter arshaanensis]|uniref:TetR/AcrR family transcriptional regulator n=1 Tax=Glacieibacterium arshaanense TaxID=2511025 RepID=A0A4Y9ER49_9SPHN|nr:TetR/AcrR family transcriptional regulator [Polymorphobacter arshaanensis]TFU05683.1 TetR/AcrR family transcriptional regulator [Polymorphobacter arshaanensis]
MPSTPAPRRNRTREALLAAGAALLAERPIDALAVDDIVNAAGVAKGSFYNHFADKAALAAAVGDRVRADIETRVDAANAGVTDPALRLVRGICVYVDFALGDAARARIMARGLRAAAAMPGESATDLHAGLRADIALGLTAGRFALPTSDVGTLFVAGVGEAALAAVLAPTTTPQFAILLAQQLCALVLKAFGLPQDEADRIAAQAAHEVIRQPS